MLHRRIAHGVWVRRELSFGCSLNYCQTDRRRSRYSEHEFVVKAVSVSKQNLSTDRASDGVAAAGHDVLIVDDDQHAARALAAILTQAGFRTTVLHTGKAALDHAQTHRISAAIIDVHLTDLNGLVLSMNLRDRFGSETPIFVVSGDTSMETLNSLPMAGATYFFAKPMSPPYIIERLTECLGRKFE
jgi:PleD family two-component response regulator